MVMLPPYQQQVGIIYPSCSQSWEKMIQWDSSHSSHINMTMTMDQHQELVITTMVQHIDKRRAGVEWEDDRFVSPYSCRLRWLMQQ